MELGCAGCGYDELQRSAVSAQTEKRTSAYDSTIVDDGKNCVYVPPPKSGLVSTPGFMTLDDTIADLSTRAPAYVAPGDGYQDGGTVPNQPKSAFRDALYRPGIDNAQSIPVSEIAGHFVKPQLVGQAFVGVYSPNLGRKFVQDDLNLMVAHSQFLDQLRDLDAADSGMRYLFNPHDFLDERLRDIQRAEHSLNNLGAAANKDRIFDVANQHPGDLEFAGHAMHPFEDSEPHEYHDSVLGHAGESIMRRSPDYITRESGMRTAVDTIQFFERVLGVKADTVLDGQETSIHDNAMNKMEAALERAGDGGATGLKFEKQFIAAGHELLKGTGALNAPTLPNFDLRGSTRSEAIEITRDYLKSINLNADPQKFLDKALWSGATIINHYLDFTHSPITERIDPASFLRPPVSNTPRPQPMRMPGRAA